MVAGTDLAERALGALKLEAFLLRRADQLFLRTDDDVRRRLAKLRSRLEGDLRYPVNSVYCYSSAWQEAVKLLATEANAVLMDLRGFSRRNQGCVFELTWIVQRLSLARILLLTDESTDYSALEATVYEAWSPVTERSGKKKWVHSRWACPKFLRQSFHEWAGHSIAQSAWARAHYQQQRQRGKDHHAAVRALAFKWIRIVFCCWQDGEAYDENRYLATLAKRGSPLCP